MKVSSSDSWEYRRNLVINEVKQGRELAKQLGNHLNSANETREYLLKEILKSYDKVLWILGGVSSDTTQVIGTMFDSSHSHNNSPQSEDSDPANNKDTPSKKRMLMARWSKQVQVSEEIGIEKAFDDGFNWRKYGQKEILGAKYPRGYYRCSQRISQGCLATKQVQKSDEDSTLYEVTYRGKHTCTQPTLLSPPPLPPLLPSQEPFSGLVDNNNIRNFSPPFVSPITSSSDYDLHEMVSLSTRGTNGNIPFGHIDNFTFDNSDYFS